MARTRSETKEAKPSNASLDLEPEALPKDERPAAVVANPPPMAIAESEGQGKSEPAAEPPTRTPIVTPDPRGVMSASLGDGQRMQLLRSHRYQQLQIRFDQQPDEKYLAMLAEAGWRDRTQEEGIWTKQIPKGEWKPVADAERLFRDIANDIRQDKGLESVSVGLSVA